MRVQLAGEDAEVEVRLGREDFAKRFRQALEVLDAQRQTPRGPYIVGVDVSQGKRAVISTGSTAQYSPDAAVRPPKRPKTPPLPRRRPPTRRRDGAAAQGPKKKASPAARRPAKTEERKGQPQQPTNVATRPRRVG